MNRCPDKFSKMGINTKCEEMKEQEGFKLAEKVDSKLKIVLKCNINILSNLEEIPRDFSLGYVSNPVSRIQLSLMTKAIYEILKQISSANLFNSKISTK